LVHRFLLGDGSSPRYGLARQEEGHEIITILAESYTSRDADARM